MARGRKSGSSRSNDSTERVLSNNATAIRAVLGEAQFYQPAPISYLSEIEDYRRFHPAGELRSPMTVFGSPASFGANYGQGTGTGSDDSGASGSSGLGGARHFADAGQVVVCVRRKVRREVLFAKGLQGGGGGRRFRSWRSNIRCK